MRIFHILLPIVLLGLGVYMIYLGNKADMQPPTITGIGFILIALMRLLDRKP